MSARSAAGPRAGSVLAAVALGLSGLTAQEAAAAVPEAAPVVIPTPQQLESNGSPLRVPDTVRLIAPDGVEETTSQLIKDTLLDAGAVRVDTTATPEDTTGVNPAEDTAQVDPAANTAEADPAEDTSGTDPADDAAGAYSAARSNAEDGGAALPRDMMTVVVGPLSNPLVERALNDAGGAPAADPRPEGYSLATLAGDEDGDGGLIALAGNDSDGTYYAAQTLSQLIDAEGVAAVTVVDHPLMPLRGVVEGFYGAPWSHDDRMDQLAFYGHVKANTYIYTPKDDPYLRDKWRDPYPAAELGRLSELIDQAERHHVRFTYAVSPGPSICYSDPADPKTLHDKLNALYDIGARSFSIALDDIDHRKWNCPGDEKKYGPAGRGAAGRAQADLLNSVQRDVLDAHDDTEPLQTVPTEYSGFAESDYKRELRDRLDDRIVVQWTGTAVISPSVTVADADKAAKVWGRKVFLWDNYPVNDFQQTEGRLLLAPYDARETGLHSSLGGTVLNPMIQAAPSKVALFGGAAFAWNAVGYDPDETWRASAEYIAGGDARTTEALLAFFDTQHLAPVSRGEPWQPQAPVLKEKTDAVRAAVKDGSQAERAAALRDLEDYAQLLQAAPERIRDGVPDPAFAAQSAPWLDALALWGEALRASVRGLELADRTDAQAAPHFDRAERLAKEASAITTVPGTTRPQGPVRVADGVLDTFISDSRTLIGVI